MPAERALRAIALRRKAWFFAQSRLLVVLVRHCTKNAQRAASLPDNAALAAESRLREDPVIAP
jgi:hypothetical protein